MKGGVGTAAGVMITGVWEVGVTVNSFTKREWGIDSNPTWNPCNPRGFDETRRGAAGSSL